MLVPTYIVRRWGRKGGNALDENAPKPCFNYAEKRNSEPIRTQKRRRRNTKVSSRYRRVDQVQSESLTTLHAQRLH